MIVWQLDSQLPMQSVLFTTDVLSSNLDQDEVYNIMWSSLSLTYDRSVAAAPASSTNKTDRHDITQILLKGALNTIKRNKNMLT
jgi:hypothetical protein